MKKVGITHLFFGTPQYVGHSFNNRACTSVNFGRFITFVVSKPMAKNGSWRSAIATQSVTHDRFGVGINWLGYAATLGLKI
jgi:hypothetical protein